MDQDHIVECSGRKFRFHTDGARIVTQGMILDFTGNPIGAYVVVNSSRGKIWLWQPNVDCTQEGMSLSGYLIMSHRQLHDLICGEHEHHKVYSV